MGEIGQIIWIKKVTIIRDWIKKIGLLGFKWLLNGVDIYIYIYIYKTEVFEILTIFHVSTIFK